MASARQQAAPDLMPLAPVTTIPMPPASATPAEASGPEYMPLNLYYPGLKKVHASPPIYVCDGFLTDEECDAFIRAAGPLLQRSKTHAIAGKMSPAIL